MPIEDVQPDEAGSKPIIAEDAPKSRSALSRLKRELSDEELKEPGVQKMLLDSLFRAEEDNARLSSFREKYYEADKQNCVLNEKMKRTTAAEILSTGTITVGAAILVYVPELWKNPVTGLFALFSGFILIGVGIAAKWVRA